MLFWCLAAIGVYWEWTAEVVKAPLSAEIAGVGVLASPACSGRPDIPGRFS